MLKIKVTEEEKNEILNQINKELQSYIYEEYEPERIEKEINLLKNENIVSQTLIMMFYINISIQLSPELYEALKQDFSDEQDVFENITKNNYIRWGNLKDIYNGYNILKRKEIVLEPEIMKLAILLKRTAYTASNAKDEKKRNEIIEKIKTGKVFLDELEYILDLSRKIEISYDSIRDYNNGKISEDELLINLGSREANADLLKFGEDYEKDKRFILENSVREAFKSHQLFNVLDEQLPEALKSKFDNLLLSMNTKDLSRLDISVLESFVNKYNELANEAWNIYLDEENTFLIHATTIAIEGEFREPIMSTSLISIPDLVKTYSNRKIGYLVKPKQIQRANSNDLYTYNWVEDIYASVGTSNTILVKLPQVVKHESKLNDGISEIVLEDYEIKSVVFLSNELPNKYEIGYLEKQSKAQNNLPIKMLSPKGLVTIEEAQVQKGIEHIEKCRSDLIQKQVELLQIYTELGLESNRISYVSLHASVRELIELTNSFDANHYSSNKVEEITNHFGDVSKINNIFSECMNMEDSKYLEALGKKVQNLICQVEKQKLNIEYEEVLSQKLGFISGLMGKSKLKYQMLYNIKLREKLIQPKEKSYSSSTEIIEELYSYVIENGVTTGILNFLTNYKEIIKLTKKEQELIEIIEQQNLISQKNTMALVEIKSIGDIKSRTNALIAENKELSEKISIKYASHFNESLSANHPIILFQAFANKGKELLKKQDSYTQDKEHEVE